MADFLLAMLILWVIYKTGYSTTPLNYDLQGLYSVKCRIIIINDMEGSDRAIF
jgi:hypothetical protein